MTHVRLSDAEQERLALYALRSLDGDEVRLVEAHLTEGCRTCRAELDALQHVAGDLALAAPPRQPPAAVRARVLAAAARPAPSLPPFFFQLASEQWEDVSPGVTRRVLAGDAYVIRVAPGTRVDPHPHALVEHCYVIEGDLFIAGRHLRTGDYHRAAAGTVHDGIRSDGGALLLVIESPA